MTYNVHQLTHCSDYVTRASSHMNRHMGWKKKEASDGDDHMLGFRVEININKTQHWRRGWRLLEVVR